jgi:hypothetical protein
LSGWEKSNFCFALANLDLATKLLQLAHIEAFELNFDYEHLDRRLLLTLVEISKVLKREFFWKKF